MIFDTLVQAWRMGDPALRAGASLELRNLSGTSLGWHRSGQETDLVLFGDGTLQYFRRGDFGERGGKPPGMWRGKCEPADVDSIWNALFGLTEKDFEGRAADPGDPVTQLQAQCGGFAAALSWGPGEMGLSRPGVESLIPLRQLVVKAQEKTVWTLRMRQEEIAHVEGGVRVQLQFSNEGSEPVSFLISPPGMGVGLEFKFAVDESDENGPALQINWMDADVMLPGESTLRIANAVPGEFLWLESLIPIELTPGERYLGQFTYTQLELGERLAGRKVFAGMTFTDIFKFKAAQ